MAFRTIVRLNSGFNVPCAYASLRDKNTLTAQPDIADSRETGQAWP